MINPTPAVLIDFKCDIKTRESVRGGRGRERGEGTAGEGNK